MDDHLLGWLRTLDEDRLGRILATRPDAIAAPWPRRLDTLSHRLGHGVPAVEGPGAPLDHYPTSWTTSNDTRPPLARNLGLPPDGNKRRTVSRASEVLGDRDRL